jgi:hypothetical protein
MAVAGLAWHGICAPRLILRTGSAHAAPVQPLPWLCRCRPVGCSLCRASTSAAAADPSASLRGGLVREAAVGRRRRECDFVGNKDAPSSPRSFERRRVCSKLVRESSVKATLHSNASRVPRHGHESPVLASWRFVLVAGSCGRSAIMPRPPQSEPLHVPVQWLLTSSGRESLPPAAPIAPAPSGLITLAARLPHARPSLLRRCGRAKK